STTIYLDDFDFKRASVSPQATPRPTVAVPADSAAGQDIDPPAPTPASAAVMLTPGSLATASASPTTASAESALALSATPSPVSEVSEAVARQSAQRSPIAAGQPTIAATSKDWGSGWLVWPAGSPGWHERRGRRLP